MNRSRAARAIAISLAGLALILAGLIWILGLHWAWLAMGVGVLIVVYGLCVIDVDEPTER